MPLNDVMIKKLTPTNTTEVAMIDDLLAQKASIPQFLNFDKHIPRGILRRLTKDINKIIGVPDD